MSHRLADRLRAVAVCLFGLALNQCSPGDGPTPTLEKRQQQLVVGAPIAPAPPIAPVPLPPVAPPTVVVPNLYIVTASSGITPLAATSAPGALTVGAPIAAFSVQPDSIAAPTTLSMRSAADSTVVKPLSSAQPGDYLVSDPSLPQYFLRQVTAVSSANGQVVLTTTQAALADVVQQGQFEQIWGQSATGPVPVTAQPGIAQPSTGTNNVCIGGIGACLDLSGTVLGLVGAEGKAQVTFGGHANFSPSLDIGGQISGFSLTEFHAIASGSLDVELDATLSTTGKFLLNSPIQITILQKSAYFLDFIGPVPVEETVAFSVAVRCQGYSDTTDSIMAGAGFSSSVSAGARWQNGAWTGVANQSFQPRLVGPTFGHQAGKGFKCWVRPRLDVYFYDLLGPGIYVEPYAQYDQVSAPPNWNWTVYGGVDAAIAGSIKVLWFKLVDLQLKLFDLSFPIASGTISGGTGGSGGGSGGSSGGGGGGGSAGSGGSSGSGGGSGGTSGGTDPCANTQYGGLYCGQSTQYGFSGGQTDWLYDCENHVTKSKSFCGYGCFVAPPGTNDYCKAAPGDPCASAQYGGMYCGQSTQYGFSGGLTNWLYDCENHATATKAFCPTGCIVEPPGQNDQCASGSCNSCPANTSCSNGSCVCGGPVCGGHCCPAGGFCGGGGTKCCDGITCSAGCPC
jgi:hypothetical protein